MYVLKTTTAQSENARAHFGSCKHDHVYVMPPITNMFQHCSTITHKTLEISANLYNLPYLHIPSPPVAYLECIRRPQLQLQSQRVGRAGAHAVEDVVVALLATLHADARLLEQIMRDVAATHQVLQRHKHTTHQVVTSPR